MNFTLIIFLLFAALTIGAGLWLALTKNIIHAAFLFFVILFGTAALFVFAGAEFLAVSQVIIYVGGILIVLLFGVMLTHKLREARPETRIINVLPGLLVSGVLLAGLVFMIFHFRSTSGTDQNLMARQMAMANQMPEGGWTVYPPISALNSGSSDASGSFDEKAIQEAIASAPTPPSDVEVIGKQTITEYLLPFEAISVLLLIALIGAAYISRKGKGATDRRSNPIPEPEPQRK